MTVPAQQGRFEFKAWLYLPGGGWQECYQHRTLPDLRVLIYQRLPWTPIRRVVVVEGEYIDWGDWPRVAHALEYAKLRRSWRGE